MTRKQSSTTKWRGDKDIVVDKKPRRYSIQWDDSGHKYFVEVGMEGEFERWLQAEIEGLEYNGHDYENNRIDGTFTFTDPRCE